MRKEIYEEGVRKRGERRRRREGRRDNMYIKKKICKKNVVGEKEGEYI